MADRIVIMEKGKVQQVGTPREVYNNPKNLFVAGFIGSPSMNMLDAELQGDRVTGQGFELTLPERLKTATQKHNARDVIVGMRPEHFASAEVAGGTSESAFAPVELDVKVAEYIGSSQFLAADIGGKQISAAIEVGPDSAPLESGSYLFDTSRLYLFDRASGEAIT